jgi:hypothetical protein
MGVNVDVLSKLFIVWLTLDLAILMVLWFLAGVIRPHFPKWWKQNVCDVTPITY